MKSKSLIYFIMFLSGIVVGSLVGKITSGISFLSWLSYGIVFGTKTPISIDFGVLSFDLGLSVNLTISCIIFIFVAMILGRKVF